MNVTDMRESTIGFCSGLLAKMALDGAKKFTIRDYPEKEISAALFNDSEGRAIPIPREELAGVKEWFRLVSENPSEGSYFSDVEELLLNGPSLQLIAQRCAFEFGKHDNDPLVKVTLPSVQ